MCVSNNVGKDSIIVYCNCNASGYQDFKINTRSHVAAATLECHLDYLSLSKGGNISSTCIINRYSPQTNNRQQNKLKLVNPGTPLAVQTTYY